MPRNLVKLSLNSTFKKNLPSVPVIQTGAKFRKYINKKKIYYYFFSKKKRIRYKRIYKHCKPTIDYVKLNNTSIVVESERLPDSSDEMHF